jgi:2-polyprenyl-3-methyl-5-hydroxy-6-metoxy-1,4-benzoquinol methylase
VNHFNKRQLKYWSAVRFRPSDDPVVAAYADPKLEYLQRHVSLDGKSILDIGCGNGIFTTRLAGIANRVVGLDLFAHMLTDNPHPLRVQGSALRLPFGDKSFDIVFAANLLHHVDDPFSVLCEMARCASSHLILIEPNRINPVMFGFGLLVRAERGLLKSSRRRLIQMVERVGFRIKADIRTGMISQNNTPIWLVPLLRRFDRNLIWGEYIILCGERVNRP